MCTLETVSIYIVNKECAVIVDFARAPYYQSEIVKGVLLLPLSNLTRNESVTDALLFL